MQVIKLSDAVQDLPRQATQYVHGAPECFLRIGDDAAVPEADEEPRFSKGAYTLGKMVWGKVPTQLTCFPDFVYHYLIKAKSHNIMTHGAPLVSPFLRPTSFM